jgi:hypothetical protein
MPSSVWYAAYSGKVLRALIHDALVFYEKPLVNVRIRKAQVEGAGKRLPHLPPEPVREADLNEPCALGIAKEGEIAAMGCVSASVRDPTQRRTSVLRRYVVHSFVLDASLNLFTESARALG